MHTYNKLLQLFIIVFVFICILLGALGSSFQSYYGYYYPERTDRTLIADIIVDARQIKIFKRFMSYTGFNTGYGFFGPSVASEVITFFKIYDENGKCIKSFNSIKFKSKEGAVRFNSISSLFLEKFEGKDKKGIQYANILMKQIMKYLKTDYPKNYTIKCDMCLVGYPDVKAFNMGVVDDILLIKSYTL